MILSYHRPGTVPEALALLDLGKEYIPVGGGSTLEKHQGDVHVVDLQSLDLNKIEDHDEKIIIGAATKLEELLHFFSDQPAFKTAITIEASRNQREQATIGGVVCSSDGRSPLLTLLSALDLQMIWLRGNLSISIGDYLAQRSFWNRARLVTEFHLDKKAVFGFEAVGRSPLDTPMISLGVAHWSSGRMRVVAGGFGAVPRLILDGNARDDILQALAMGLVDASDQWAAADYRIHAAQKLASRMLVDLHITAGEG